jgi:citrate synthase
MTQESGYLSARDAAAALGVRPQTLYAYVSRGLVRSQATGRRDRRYHVAAEAALSFGAPVLDSAITLILDGKLYYRGQDAAVLARRATIEDVAALLWQADAAAIFGEDNLPLLGTGFAEARRAVAGLQPIERCLALLPIAAAADPGGLDTTAAGVARTGVRILRLAAAVVANRDPSPRPVDAVLAEAWGLGAPAQRLLRAALILCADHELNASAFAARCAASAQASPYNAVIAGIATLQGARHGGASERADAFLGEALAAADPAALCASYLRRGDRLPSFGHPLYPGEDPRARVLFDLMAEHGTLVAEARHVAAAAAALIGRQPNIDFALALLARALELPEGAALALFLVGRSMGWLAQAAEQYAVNRLIRPRARYVGPPVP